MKIKSLIKPALCAAAIGVCGIGLTAAAAQDQFEKNTSASTKTCFRVDKVEGFASVKFGEGVDGVNLRVNREVYQMQFATPCPSIREAQRIAIDSRTPAYVCTGADADIVTYSRLANAERCKINGVRKIAAADISSLPEKERP